MSYKTIFTGMINPIFVVRHFQMSFETIFTDRINPIFVIQHFQMSYETIFINICWIVYVTHKAEVYICMFHYVIELSIYFDCTDNG
jgi:hypothetical protein